ncbi:hypothetical protein BP5796_07557 [Coleophoma crateriformis]|uniref:SMP-30/Gluconolactonase/LRE-like region domain-containing protein n=1 Tax=Coleophoma crateriformis TaxID=565419 RepID=A0A3D8RJ96_9HELO|nr:hypothetical protein BP5796_07557 [Coleophoma crateriformis]
MIVLECNMSYYRPVSTSGLIENRGGCSGLVKIPVRDGDGVPILDIDNPQSDGLYNLQALTPTGSYTNSQYGLKENLDMLGFDVEILADGTRRFYMVNHRPPISKSGVPLDAKKLGANSTFEVFDLEKGGSELKHVRTIASEAIIVPNSIAADGKGGFYFTNDHGSKIGIRFDLEFLFGTGSIGYSSPPASNSGPRKCNIVSSGGFYFPNGIVLGHDGLIYVAHSAAGKVSVHKPKPSTPGLEKVAEIPLKVTLDNLSVDTNGDIFAAAMPHVFKTLIATSSKGNGGAAPAAVWRIPRRGLEDEEMLFEAEKILEDGKAKVLPVMTIAVSDAETGRLFLGSASDGFVVVCAPK